MAGSFNRWRSLCGLSLILVGVGACRSGRAPESAPPAPPGTSEATTSTPGPSARQVDKFFRAASLGWWLTVNEALKEGVDINARNAAGQTALHLASANGHDELVGRLIAHGASLDVQDNNGNTPLHLAVMGDHDDTIRRLRVAGANADIRNKQGTTALGAVP